MSDELENTNEPTQGEDELLSGDDKADAELPSPEETEPVDDEEEEQEQEEEIKVEDEEGKEETEVPGLNLKAIDKAFPGIFKKFPELRKDLFLSKQIQEYIPSVDTAKELVERNEVFTNFESEILGGNSKLFTVALLSADKEASNKFISTFVDNLYEANKESYAHLVRPIIADAINEIRAIGEKSKNSNLVAAAKLFSMQFFQNYDVPNFKKNTEDPERKKFEQEKQGFERSKFLDFRGGTISELESGLFEEIQRDLDPNKVLPSFVKESMIDKIKHDLSQILTADKAHMARMDAFWAKAPVNDLNAAREHRARILSAFLARAKRELPALKKKYLNEFMKTSGKGIRKETRDIPSGGTVRTNKPKVISPAYAKEHKLTDDDILGG